jgi:hypothetical protein
MKKNTIRYIYRIKEVKAFVEIMTLCLSIVELNSTYNKAKVLIYFKIWLFIPILLVFNLHAGPIMYVLKIFLWLVPKNTSQPVLEKIRLNGDTDKQGTWPGLFKVQYHLARLTFEHENIIYIFFIKSLDTSALPRLNKFCKLFICVVTNGYDVNSVKTELLNSRDRGVSSNT